MKTIFYCVFSMIFGMALQYFISDSISITEKEKQYESYLNSMSEQRSYLDKRKSEIKQQIQEKTLIAQQNENLAVQETQQENRGSKCGVRCIRHKKLVIRYENEIVKLKNELTEVEAKLSSFNPVSLKEFKRTK